MALGSFLKMALGLRQWPNKSWQLLKIAQKWPWYALEKNWKITSKFLQIPQSLERSATQNNEARFPRNGKQAFSRWTEHSFFKSCQTSSLLIQDQTYQVLRLPGARYLLLIQHIASPLDAKKVFRLLSFDCWTTRLPETGKLADFSLVVMRQCVRFNVPHLIAFFVSH